MNGEFKVPWKNGEILVMRNWLFIFCETRPTDHRDGVVHPLQVIIYHALISMDNTGVNGYISLGKGPGIGYINDFETRGLRTDIRPATNMEKEMLFEHLEYKGTMWDAENLQLRYKDGRPYPSRI